MSILPDRVDELIAFCSSHQKTWANAPATIGLTAGQVSALGTQVGVTSDAVEAQQSARDAAKAATTAARNEVSDLRTNAADLIRAIKSFAEMQADPEAVYAAAQIPPPAPPGPTPPPGTPFDLAVELLGNGALRLKWKCNNPSGTQGTIYEVFRKIGGGDFVYAGAIGTRSFTDETLPAGSSPVTYQITGVRSTQRGNPAQFVVNFGVGGGGGLTIASITSGDGTVKMAA